MTNHGDGAGTEGKPRKRISQACDACNRRKIKCDGSRPSCSTCKKLGLDCSYVRPAKKRGPKMGFIAALSQRLSKIERQILDTSTAPEIRKENGALADLDDMMVIEKGHDEELESTSSHNDDGTSSSDGLYQAPPALHPPLSPSTITPFDMPSMASGTATFTVPQAQQQPTSFMEFMGGEQDAQTSLETDNMVPMTFDPYWNASNSGSLLPLPEDCPLLADKLAAGLADCPNASNTATTSTAPATVNPPCIANDFSFLSFGEDAPSTTAPSAPPTSAPTDVGPPIHMLKGDVFLFSQTTMPEVSSQLVGRTKSINWALLDVYFDNIYPMVSVIPKAQFYEWAPMESDFLLNMMYAFASKHGHCATEAKKYLEAAKADVLKAMDNPCLSSIHGLYLLGYYCAVHEKSPLISSFLALAIKMAFVLRLNREDDVDYNAVSYSIFTRRQNVEIVRRLWWSLVVADQMERRFGGECLSIRDEDCRTCLSTDDDIAWADMTSNKYHLWIEPGSQPAQKQIAALSSTAPFYPCFEAPGHQAALLQLCKIDRRIFQFQKKQASTNLTETQLTQELQQIMASLEALNQKVDPVLTQALEINIAPACLTESHAYWKRMFYHVFYQSLFQDLCRSEINGCPPSGSNIPMRETPVFQKISASADTSAVVIRKFLEQNPKLSYVPPLMSYMIFSNGMVHLLGTKFNSEDPVFLANKSKYLNETIQVLLYHGEMYHQGLKYAQILRTVMTMETKGDSNAQCKAVKAHVSSMLDELKSF